MCPQQAQSHNVSRPSQQLNKLHDFFFNFTNKRVTERAFMTTVFDQALHKFW